MEDDEGFLGVLSSLLRDGAQLGDATGFLCKPVMLPGMNALTLLPEASSAGRREAVALADLMVLWRDTCACQMSVELPR